MTARKPGGKAAKKGLGRGLSALMSDIGAESPAGGAARKALAGSLVPIERISPNPDQPRKRFDEAGIAELAKSLKASGIIQPLVVRKDPGKPGQYQIVAGERRWRAAQRAGIHEAPVVVRDLTDAEVMQLALVENIQRTNLNPIEEGAALKRLMDEFGHTQEELSSALGKSRSHVANLLRLLGLPGEVRRMVESGQLTAGHARALVVAKNPGRIAREIARDGLSVRQAESMVKREGERKKPAAGRRGGGKDADTLALQQDLGAALGMKVVIEHAGKGGRVIISYSSLERLDELCSRLSSPG